LERTFLDNDTHDLIVAKLFANREKDIEDKVDIEPIKNGDRI